MKPGAIVTRAFLGLSLMGCSPAALPLSVAPVTPGGAPSAARPRMHGTCTITNDVDTRTYTYEDDRLVRSTSSEGVENTYTYAGDLLVRVDFSRDDDLRFSEAREYDDEGRIRTVVTEYPDHVGTLETRARRDFEYDDTGRLLRTTDTARDTSNALTCLCTYDDGGQLRGLTCDLPPESEQTTFEYTEEGRISAVHARTNTSLHFYDDSGRLVLTQRLEGDRLAHTTNISWDAEGHERERTTLFEDGQQMVQVTTFDGTFGPGAKCGGPPAQPPGVPLGAAWLWFQRSP